MSKAMIINSTNTAGTATSTAITNVNPNATNGELIALAQGLNGLTKNVYRGATLVEKTELVNKPEPTLRIFDSGDTQKTTVTSIQFSNQQGDMAVYQFESNSSGMLSVIKNTSGLYTRIAHLKDNTFDDDFLFLTGVDYDNIINQQAYDSGMRAYDLTDPDTTLAVNGAGEIVIQIAETTQYAAKTLTITVTA